MDDAESVVKSIMIPHTAFDHGLSLLQRHIATSKKRLAWKAQHPEATMNDSPDIILVTGDSGTGKSFLLQHAASDLHEFHAEDGWIIPAPYVKMPPKPSPITMLEGILNCYKTEEIRRRSEGYLAGRVTTLVRECQTIMVIIDEFQHLVDRRTAKVWQHASDVVKDLSEQTWCCYVLAGLSRSCGVVEQSEQLVTRVRGHIELPRFSWADQSSREEFVGCLEGFYNAICGRARIPALHEKEWPFRMYCATGGLMRLLANFLVELLSVHGEKRKIGLAEFADAYKTFRYAGKKPIARCGPFDTEFLNVADKEVLAAVATIGREVDENEWRDDSRGRQRSAPAPAQRERAARRGKSGSRSATGSTRRRSPPGRTAGSI